MTTDMVPCRACGHQIHTSAQACPKCGAIQRTKPLKSRTAAALLAFFLGGLGIHRFYLGQWWGVFYLLLCWTGVPGAVALIETIVFLARGQKAFDEAHNGGVDSSGTGAGGAVIAVVAVIGAVFLIGVLAAIALPQYQTYTRRAKVQQVYEYGRNLTLQISGFVDARGRLPVGVEELPQRPQAPALVDSATIDGKTGLLVLRVHGLVNLETNQIEWQPERSGPGTVAWRCSSPDIPTQWLPTACR